VKGPQYSDPADGIQLLRVAAWFGPACYGMLSLSWYFMFHKGWISGGVFALLLVLNLPLTVLGIFVIHRAVGSAAVGLVHTIFAVGDIPPEPTYPQQDVLIARGQYAEAADWFRDHIRIEPDDHDARLRLAQLLESHLQGYDEAERLYLEIRKAEPPADRRQQMRAANGLIDVHRKTGRRDRLKVELARFVDRYGGTSFADGAARELKELKEADLTSESRHSPR
jgi:tetratricopeptide (TPR) repeat protein